jgi:hypothetical protein
LRGRDLNSAQVRKIGVGIAIGIGVERDKVKIDPDPDLFWGQNIRGFAQMVLETEKSLTNNLIGTVSYMRRCQLTSFNG